MTPARLQELIDACNAQIDAYNAAILSLTSGEIKSYSLNTGQTVQNVTLLSIKTLTDALDSAMNRCATLEARRNGSTILGQPAW